MRTSRLVIIVATVLPVAWVQACNSNNSTPSQGDAGDSSVSTFEDSPTGTIPEGNTVVPEGSSDSTTAGPVSKAVTKTNLFADTADGGAPHVDPNLVNSWGLAFSPTGIAWISDNGPGLATLYETNVTKPLPRVVTIPPPDGAEAGATATPSGQILNGAGTGTFMGDTFIISTEDGTVAGWNGTSNPFNDAGMSTATKRYDNSAAGAVYKGLAIDPTTPPTLLLADFHNNHVDVLDSSYNHVTPDAGTAWTDPSIPAGYAPFNITVFSSNVYISYAKQAAPNNHDDAAGPGQGALSVFSTSGTLVKSLVATGGALNSPWGMAIAPSGWGKLGGMLLVGNFGDGLVNAYNPTSGAFAGKLVTAGGTALSIDGLWALVFGVNNPDAGIATTQLYFTAGPNHESDGLFGYLTPQ